MQGYISQAILNLGEWLFYNCIANYTSNNNKLPGPVMLMTYHIYSFNQIMLFVD